MKVNKLSEHILLTGATGLLGRYLMRDLLLANVPLAVHVRRNRKQTAEQRIDGLLSTWEHKFGQPLTRPKVLEGDITQPSLGLKTEDLKWIEKNVDSVLNNAASLSFESGDRNAEPWLSNVDALETMLKVCEQTSICDFHHVSTAYICGLRKGRIYENDREMGQDFSNDYERSKIQAEQMVRESHLFEEKTFYRPAIIIGDSRTGFTTTFHGFYAVLRLAYTLMQSEEGQKLQENNGTEAPPVRLTLSGHETKNLVPVDWVSEVMTHIICNRDLYGKTYHLTPRNRVTASMLHDTIENCYGRSNTVFTGKGDLEDPTFIERLFYENLQTYKTYWRDDPEFDSSNTLLAAPHLPCPEITPELLKHLGMTATKMGFRFNDKIIKNKRIPENLHL